jgi:hypothetical protein
MAASPSCPAAGPGRDRLTRLRLRMVVLVFATLVLAPATRALAGQAASGELFFYPCTGCHPVTPSPGTGRPARALPNGFKGHEVVLEGHDKLGRGNAACLACHDEAGKDPGQLKGIGGGLIDIKGDITQVCYRCHSTKYKEWKVGAHGRGEPKCTSAGCHDPHTPGWIYAGPLIPFVGTGFQFKVLSERAAFSPLAPPAPAPPVETPAWFLAAAVAGLVAVGGLAGRLVLERQKR